MSKENIELRVFLRNHLCADRPLLGQATRFLRSYPNDGFGAVYLAVAENDRRADRYSSRARLLFQLEQRVESGLPPKSKLFSTVIDDYIAFRERDHAHGKTSDGMLRQIVRVSKFWRKYSGATAIDAIDDKVMQENNRVIKLDLILILTALLHSKRNEKISQA